MEFCWQWYDYDNVTSNNSSIDDDASSGYDGVLVEVEIEVVMVMLMKMDITMLQAMTMRGKANNDDNVPVFWPGN